MLAEEPEVAAADHTLFVGEITKASGDAAIVDFDGQYKQNPNVIAQVTGNVFLAPVISSSFRGWMEGDRSAALTLNHKSLPS